MKMAPSPPLTPTTSRSRIVDVRVRAMRLSGSEGSIWAHPKTVSYTAARCTSIGDYLCGMEASHTMSSVLVLLTLVWLGMEKRAVFVTVRPHVC